MNFVHDVNLMRKSMKSTYAESADLRALNSKSCDGPMNCRVQVLPVCWRHLLQFPQKRERKGERDLGDLGGEEDDCWFSTLLFCHMSLLDSITDFVPDPSLEDITIEGVTFARSLISDLALDVLLYQSAYREQISDIVLKESNRIFNLFMERNPNFQGKVHIVGHSLGSAIMFDILCRQREDVPRHDQKERKESLRSWPSKEPAGTSKEANELRFSFEVEDFYCLGSPIGLFQMLKGRCACPTSFAPSVLLHRPSWLELYTDPIFPAPSLRDTFLMQRPQKVLLAWDQKKILSRRLLLRQSRVSASLPSRGCHVPSLLLRLLSCSISSIPRTLSVIASSLSYRQRCPASSPKFFRTRSEDYSATWPSRA